jgi:hypothetical protein
MSKQNLEKALRRELEVLNDVIDQKIVKGLSYAREARRHKSLILGIANLRRASRMQSGWFSRSFSLVSTFLF